MKKRTGMIFLIIIFAFFCLACPPLTDPSGGSVEIDPGSAEIEIYESFQLTASTTQDPILTETYIWSSDNDDIASVDQTGMITGEARGETIVRVTASLSGETAECPVTVLYPSSWFITIWDTSKTGTGSTDDRTITIPLVDGGIYDFVVSWGDGTADTITAWDDPNAVHTYPETGRYSVIMDGLIDGFSFGLTNTPTDNDRLKFEAIMHFGPLDLGTTGSSFFGCSNLYLSLVEDVISPVNTRFYKTFEGCTHLTTIQHIEDWDVSNVADMRSMFAGAENFNDDFPDWDLSGAINLDYMFQGAEKFNGDISNWDVSGVEYLNYMFADASVFNSDITGWRTESAVNLSYMFRSAVAFNQDLGGWDVSSVVTMQGMFFRAANFNCDLNDWDIISVKNMNSMFGGAESFNGNITGWDVSGVENMKNMFSVAAVGETSVFNQDISGWNVSSVTTVHNMFRYATAFSKDVGGWDVSSVENFNSMFSHADSFSSDISGWQIQAGTDMGSMFAMVDLPTTVYNNMLIAWAALDVNDNLHFDVGRNTNYSGQAAIDAHDHLTDVHGWSIGDGGPE